MKLLEEALTRRNVDIEQAEDNNRQLLSLLEKYDNKLDELQEDNELKDMKIFEYERKHLNERPKIQIEAIEDKIKFLVQVLGRLKVMYVEGVRDRIEEIKEKVGVKESDLEYPTLPPSVEEDTLRKRHEDITKDSKLKLEEQIDYAVENVEVIQENRVKREELTEQERVMR